MKVARWLILSIASISLFGIACSPAEEVQEPVEDNGVIEGVEEPVEENEAIEGEAIEEEGVEGEAVEGE